MNKLKVEKNESAVALARLRSERLSPERRLEISRKASAARWPRASANTEKRPL